MRVQLGEKSKSEFIELIAKDSITCWFEGDEFVMPSGQGKTAKGIVLGKLVVWQSRQTEVDELKQENNNLKSLIQGHELRHSQNLSIKKKLVARNDELQKRLDAALEVIMEYYTGSYDESPDLVVDLEQALKGGEE